MNYSTALFLINDDARAIHCVYEPDGVPTLFKTLDQTIKVDDLVIVESSTRHGFTVCKVTEIDYDLDLGSHTKMDWIVGRVDHVHHEKLKEQEAEAITAIKAAERRKKRKELRQALFDDHDETLKELQIANAGGDTLPAPDKADTTD